MKQKCFKITTKQVRRSQQFQLHRQIHSSASRKWRWGKWQ